MEIRLLGSFVKKYAVCRLKRETRRPVWQSGLFHVSKTHRQLAGVAALRAALAPCSFASPPFDGFAFSF